MLKRLAWQPKGENKRATARPNPVGFWRAMAIVVPGADSPMRKAPDTKCASAALLSTEKLQ
jgi:hypothetical protein